MQKWEYHFYNRRGTTWNEILSDLNELGALGWEVIASDFELRRESDILYYHSILKRAIH